MRDSFVDTLFRMACLDKDIVLLTADLGFGIFEKFEKLRGQYYNVGISEQNMIGVASGLALLGKKIVVYSIGNFPTLRCLEQIRNDACYHELNITIVSSGGGFSYGSLGMSHHATEDLSVMRSMPKIIVLSPCTSSEAGYAIAALLKEDGVGYLRLDKSSASDTVLKHVFSIGSSKRFLKGSDITLIATGGILEEVIDASYELKKVNIKARVVGMYSIKPIDKNEIVDAARTTGGIVTIEEHNLDGGLGSAVSEVCMDNGSYPKRFLRLGMDNTYTTIVGSQKYLRSRYGIDSVTIVEKVKSLIQGSS